MARRMRSRHYGGSLALIVAAATAATALDASLSPVAASLTAACWVKGTAQTTATEVLELVNSTSADGLSISISSGSLVAKVRGGTAASVAASVVLNGSWHRVTASCDASTKTIVLYVDGVQVATSGAAAWSGSFAATCKLVLGLGSIGNSALTTQDDAVIDIGHAWSALDVAADYYDANPPNSYTHRWPLDDGAGTTARATRGGLVLTLSGGAAFSADSPMIGRGVVRNSVANGNDVTASPWLALAGTAVSGAAYVGSMPTMPGAPTSAIVLTDTAANTFHYAAQPHQTLDAGAIYIVSGFVKRIAGNSFFALYGRATGGVWANIATGALASSAVAGSNIEDAGNGWYRLSYATTLTSTLQAFMANADGGASYAGGTSQVAVCGFQVEKAYPGQTTPSPYVATGPAPLSVVGAREWRQNLITNSQKLSLCSSNGATVTDSATTAPDGGSDGGRLVESAANSAHTVYQQKTGLVAGARHTTVVYAKASTRTWLVITEGNTVTATAYFNLAAGVAGSVSGTGSPSSSIVAVGGGWYRCAMTFAVGASGVANVQCGAATGDGGYSYAGDGVSGVFVWGLQFAQCNGMPDYIKTTTAPANSSGAPRSIAA